MTAQQPLATHADLTGRVLLGRYRIVRELAKGGMGVVYLARVEGAVGFVKPVVVKLLLPEHTEDDRIVHMFVREARILAQLRHPSLVDVLEFGEQDGGYVLVLEYVRGYHLGLWLRYLHEKKRNAPAGVLLSIVIDVLEALHHAHTQLHPDGSPMQIVHRDVSPSNILLDETGRGRLLDFGVARMRGGGHEYKTQVQGGFMGKLPYTAPEIFAGGEASPRSDLYACAVVLHEALFGRNVFRGETQAATLQRVLHHIPEALESETNSDVPKGLDKVLARALAKTPTERHADAHELAMDLRKLLNTPESEIRGRLSELLKQDFGIEMAKLFNLESLESRDAAWRRLSVSAPDPAAEPRPLAPSNDQGAAPALSKATAPVPAGATMVSRNRRGTTQGDGQDPAKITAPGRALSKSTNLNPVVNTDAQPENTPQRAYYDGLEDEDKTKVDPATISMAASALESAPAAEATPQSRAHAPFVLVIAGALAIAGFAVVMLVMRGQPAPSPPPPNSAPTVFHPANPGPAPTPETQPPPVVAPTPQPTAADPTPPPPETKKPTSKNAGGPNASALTRALRKQQAKLEACFLKHSVTLEGQATTQLDFDLAQDGSLTRVQLSPALLGKTDLGQCLLNVARSTRFPPQAHAVSFSIPLTASTTRK